jgi:hypothetical protein
MNPAVRYPRVRTGRSHSATALGPRCASSGMNPPGTLSQPIYRLDRPWIIQPSVRLNKWLGEELRTAPLVANFDLHMGHHQPEAERLHGAEQDPVPSLPTSPINGGIRIGAGTVGHLDRPGDDLPHREAKGNLFAETLREHELRPCRMRRVSRRRGILPDNIGTSGTGRGLDGRSSCRRNWLLAGDHEICARAGREQHAGKQESDSVAAHGEMSPWIRDTFSRHTLRTGIATRSRNSG